MFRLLSLICLGIGVSILAVDLFQAVRDGGLRFSALGEWWFWLHKESLQLLQPAIERHISLHLFDPYILAILEWPAFAEFLVLGAVFGLLGFRWRRA